MDVEHRDQRSGLRELVLQFVTDPKFHDTLLLPPGTTPPAVNFLLAQTRLDYAVAQFPFPARFTPSIRTTFAPAKLGIIPKNPRRYFGCRECGGFKSRGNAGRSAEGAGLRRYGWKRAPSLHVFAQPEWARRTPTSTRSRRFIVPWVIDTFPAQS
jgi:hypothetical protein